MCRYMIQRIAVDKGRKGGIRILDAGLLTKGQLDNARKEAVDTVVRAMNRFSDSQILCAYNPGNHWILVVFSVKRNEVFYLDSLRPEKKDDTLGE